MKYIITLMALMLFTNSLYSNSMILKWHFFHPLTNERFELGEKGSVQEAFIREGKIAHPHINDHENLFGWFEDYEWELLSEFTLTIDDLSSPRIELLLPSVDTYAKVYVNNKLVQLCDNAFVAYKVNLKEFAVAGQNNVRIIITPPMMYHQKTVAKAKYQLPAENDKGTIAVANLTRKPQYQFGWDWAFRMVTMGLNEPASVRILRNRHIDFASVQTQKVENNIASLILTAQLSNNMLEDQIIASRLFGNVRFKKTGEYYTATVELENPKLWWPKDYGNQYLYEDEWQLILNGEVHDNRTVKFGVRTAELIQQKDEIGTSYEVKINGLVIFCKGGNYIPQEVFPAAVTKEKTSKLLQQMAEANFNMVRVWGGGYYPESFFYEECDRLGLMVWQDFMFACAMYPGTPDFLNNVQKEVRFQIPRMAAHPSVVLFNGNNEVDVAWKNWGYVWKYKLSKSAQREISKAYDDLFKVLLEQEVKALSTTSYVHTSPLSNWGKDEFYNHGSQHYWGVWHGKESIEDFGNKIGRFNSEYGFQSFPQYSTLSTVLAREDWQLESELMQLRQKSYVGNAMIKKQSDILYGKTDDLEQFIYYSQLTQAKAVSIAIAGHRADWPRCAGTIYWQVNDCWAAPTWSSIDYYGNWKALHYEVKKDYENIAVVAVERQLNHKQFYLFSDFTNTYSSDIQFDFYNLEGAWIEQHILKAEISKQGVQEVPVFELMSKPLENYIVRVKWKNEFGQLFERTFHNYHSERFIAQEITYRIDLKQEGDKQIIVVSTNKPLLNCWIYADKIGFQLDKNFETLLPGVHEFEVLGDVKLELADLKIKFIQ